MTAQTLAFNAWQRRGINHKRRLPITTFMLALPAPQEHRIDSTEIRIANARAETGVLDRDSQDKRRYDKHRASWLAATESHGDVLQ